VDRWRRSPCGCLSSFCVLCVLCGGRATRRLNSRSNNSNSRRELVEGRVEDWGGGDRRAQQVRQEEEEKIFEHKTVSLYTQSGSRSRGGLEKKRKAEATGARQTNDKQKKKTNTRGAFSDELLLQAGRQCCAWCFAFLRLRDRLCKRVWKAAGGGVPDDDLMLCWCGVMRLERGRLRMIESLVCVGGSIDSVLFFQLCLAGLPFLF
jgi:hypothetical protein